MPDYRESAVTGTKWTRANRVIIDNPLGGTPTLLLVEEEVINIGTDNSVCRNVSNLSTTMNPSDPLHTAIYDKLNELYVLLREQRDAELLAPK